MSFPTAVDLDTRSMPVREDNAGRRSEDIDDGARVSPGILVHFQDRSSALLAIAGQPKIQNRYIYGVLRAHRPSRNYDKKTSEGERCAS
jgi:hypothetical protein